MAGVVHQIDQVICVRPLRQGYRPDIGDVIVGRIVQVDQKRWMVDVNSYQHAVLNLTSINLPGGIQRRRSEEDQLNIRNFFKEGDIISAEVMQVNSNDGRIMLQTRNLKYGKLLNGFMLKTDSNFIRRMKNHIINFMEDREEFGIGAIIGTNGYVWIHSPTENQAKTAQDFKAPVIKSVSANQRECMSIIRNAIVCLERE
jgi:exosome complex component RRP4